MFYEIYVFSSNLLFYCVKKKKMFTNEIKENVKNEEIKYNMWRDNLHECILQ
jgi:hypothetical protein